MERVEKSDPEILLEMKKPKVIDKKSQSAQEMIQMLQ